MQVLPIAYILLAARVLMLGFERPAFKALSRERDPVAATAIAYSIALLILLPLVCIPGLSGLLGPHNQATELPTSAWLPYALLSGLIACAGYLLYTLSLSRGEISIVSPLYSSGLIWLYLLDVLFGTASFGLRPLFGVLLVMLGIGLLNGFSPANWLPPRLFEVLRQPGALQMLLCATALAIVRVIDSRVAATAPELTYAFFATLPTVLLCGAYLLLRGRGGQITALLRERPWQSGAAALCHIGGYLLLLACLHYFQPSVVEPVSQSSLLISIAIGGAFFGEQIGKRWLPALLVIAGSILLLWH